MRAVCAGLLFLASVVGMPALAQNAVNTATVAPPSGVTDPTCNVALPECNSATDSDTVVYGVTLTKAWSNAIAGNAVSLTISGSGVSGATGGTSTAPATTTAATANATFGSTVTLAEGFTTGAAGNYTTTLACTDGGGNPVTVTGTGLSRTIVMPASAVTCTYTNSRIAQQLNLAKVWGAGSVAGHTATATTTGGTGNPTFNSTAPTNTTGTPVTVYAGDVVTLPAEGFGGGATAGSYTTTVACAGGSVLASGATGRTVTITNSSTDTTCTYTNNIVPPVIVSSKTSNPATGTTVNPGDTITYTLTTTITTAALTQAYTLTDTLSGSQTFGSVTNAGAYTCNAGGPLVCTLPAGTLPGTYTLTYTTTVDAAASGTVGNSVVGTGGGDPDPACTTCTTTHQVKPAEIRLTKTATPHDVHVGDLVRYTLVAENVGETPLSDGTLVDTPPPGFSYVDGTLTVVDTDNAGHLAGTYPIRVGGIDIPVAGTATITYVLRVGAGVQPGTHTNTAQILKNDDPVSNIATASVELASDPLFDESLILGTVFDDRDGDGWQDSAALGGVRVQGGFAADAYIANSTTVDRGAGPQPEADASSPMLHGIAIGAMTGRESDADPASAHRVVVSQLLRSPAFDDGFVLTSDEGLTLRMDAAGNTRVERDGRAAKGLTAAAPTVRRTVSQVEGGYRVDYVIENDGVDERGIPGVRIASVEGLLVETDQYGRYHLVGIDGGRWERGRNFILKVDPATLPPGSAFTTENPLVRRITPGVPVRFDFGVKLPPGLLEGGKQEVEMELGAVMFEPGSAALREQYLPVVDRMAEQVRAHGAGEVTIAANGDQALAYDRAKAVRDALVSKLEPALAQATRIELRTDLEDPASTLLSLGDAPVLGTVLFDTDQSTIKPGFRPMIDKIAADIDKLGGGVVGVVGHADRRGSVAYNDALALRRAKAVYEAIAAKLGPEARSRLRVEISDDPTAPVGLGNGGEAR